MPREYLVGLFPETVVWLVGMMRKAAQIFTDAPSALSRNPGDLAPFSLWVAFAESTVETRLFALARTGSGSQSLIGNATATARRTFIRTNLEWVAVPNWERHCDCREAGLSPLLFFHRVHVTMRYFVCEGVPFTASRQGCEATCD